MWNISSAPTQIKSLQHIALRGNSHPFVKGRTLVPSRTFYKYKRAVFSQTGCSNSSPVGSGSIVSCYPIILFMSLGDTLLVHPEATIKTDANSSDSPHSLADGSLEANTETLNFVLSALTVSVASPPSNRSPILASVSSQREAFSLFCNVNKENESALAWRHSLLCLWELLLRITYPTTLPPHHLWHILSGLHCLFDFYFLSACDACLHVMILPIMGKS